MVASHDVPRARPVSVPGFQVGVAIALCLVVLEFADARQQTIPAPSAQVVFRDIAAAAGLGVTHVNGASPEKYFAEIMGSGGLFFDFDNDGWIDIFLVDGGSIADPRVAATAKHRLYRNRGNGTFEDVTTQSGIRHREYGMGACAGDFDNDGAVDLYVTNYGPNVLYRNMGHGRFTEVPGPGGAGKPLWSTSCAFTDVDRDGYLDLFVTNYVDAQRTNNKFCGKDTPPRIRGYCHPLAYDPLRSVLYHNTGKGTFEDVSTKAGIAGYRGNGLGVAVADVDDDGWPDIFVANDGMPNFLFRNKGKGVFEEVGLLAGVSVAADSKPRAGMGTAFGDFDGDGKLDLVVTNHEFEMHSLFRSLGGGVFTDVTLESGLGPVTLPYVGFGVAFLDFDNDTRNDLAIVNGNVVDNIALFRKGAKHQQPSLLLRNVGNRFQRVKEAGPGFETEMVSRTLAKGDIDNDGDVDLLITNNGGAAQLLLNEGGNRNNALLVRTVGTKSNRDGIGARLRLSVGSRTFVDQVTSGSSYLGQHDFRVHFGLGAATKADRLEIAWPSGRVDVVENLPANHVITVREGEGEIRRVPFAR
jgi:enediyne biosynthesis protein E4